MRLGQMEIKKFFIEVIDIILTTFNEWIDDKAFRMAAALSFYSLISLAPFLLIVTILVGYIFGQQAVTGQIVSNIDEYIGVHSAELIQSLIVNAYVPESGWGSAIFGIIVFVWAALTVFVECRESLNTIWGIEVKPGKGLLEFFTSRIFSLLILLFIGVLFFLSLIAGTLMSWADEFLPDLFGKTMLVLQITDFLISFIIVTLLFIIVNKYLPSAKIEWRYTFTGALIFYILFNIGNIFIGFYLSNSNYLSVYGAAGSLVIMLLWIYYSSLIFYFSAELTQVIRKKYSDKPLVLDENVINITKVAEQIKEN
jgi:membrane protein